jgi:hypothetical protein
MTKEEKKQTNLFYLLIHFPFYPKKQEKMSSYQTVKRLESASSKALFYLKKAAVPAAAVTAATLLLTPGGLIQLPPVPQVAQHPTLWSRIVNPHKIDSKAYIVHGLIMFAATAGVLATVSYLQRRKLLKDLAERSEKRSSQRSYASAPRSLLSPRRSYASSLTSESL